MAVSISDKIEFRRKEDLSGMKRLLHENRNQFSEQTTPDQAASKYVKQK
jgi:hypothetical protein